MKNALPYVLIVLEIFVVVFLAIWGLSLIGVQAQQRQLVVRLLANATVPVPTAPATLVPTGTPLPTATPSPTSTAAPTPDPRVMLSQCGAITGPGIYQLTADLAANSDCISIQSSQVVLDCAGYAIRGTNSTGYGIIIRKFGLLGDQIPNNVEVRNCRLSKWKYGIYVESAAHLNLHDNESSDNFDDVQSGSRFGQFLGMTEGGGIRLNYVTDSELANNRTMRQAIGIDVRNSSNVRVTNNTASNNSAWGINLMRTQNSQVAGNTTADNIRQCTWGSGVIGLGCDAGGIILQDGSNHNLLMNNLVTGQNGNGIFIKAHAQACGSDNTILSNTITGALYNSIELGFCTGNKISGNTMRDSIDAVFLSFSHDVEITNNTIANMKNHGIIVVNSHNIMASGNQITDSNEALYFHTEDYDHTFFSWLPPGDYLSHDNCLCGNTLQSNTVAIHLKDSRNNQVTNNTFRNNARAILLQGKTDGTNMQGSIGLDQ